MVFRLFVVLSTALFTVRFFAFALLPESSENATFGSVEDNEVSINLIWKINHTTTSGKVDENEVVPENVTLEDLTLANTSLGYVRGKTITTVNGKEVDEYLGIPYAEPPVGELRFRKPLAKTAWQGVYNAWKPSNSCMQLVDTYLGDFPGAAMWNANTPLSEDCLYLNLWVPKPRPTNAPVMVWIYGGGFFSGTMTLDVYNGSVLASEENIIVASIQYRLGPFGFIYFGTDDAPGNQGLFDQVLALKWIQDNVENFGGHPKYVTLFGESAGAACVGLHLLSNISSDLFMQAILQSGAPTADWVTVTPQIALNRSVEFANRLDCPSEPTEAIDCLRKVDSQALVDDIPATGNVFDYYFIPVIDGNFLTRSPAESLAHGTFKRTNVLLGVTANEGSGFLIYIFPEIFQLYQQVNIKRSDFREAVFKLFPNMSETAAEALIFEYTDWVSPDESSSLVGNLEKMIGDKCILCDTNHLANAYAAASSGVFMYEFAHRSSNSPWPEWMGAHHTHEIPYVFGTPLSKGLKFSEAERNLTTNIMKYWANFARTGNPSLLPSGKFSKNFWPAHTAQGKEYLHITATYEKVHHGMRSRQCAFWKTYLPKMTKLLQESEVAAVDARSYCSNPSQGQTSPKTDNVPNFMDVDDEWNLEFQDWKRDHNMWKKEFQKYVDTLETANKLVHRKADLQL